MLQAARSRVVGHIATSSSRLFIRSASSAAVQRATPSLPLLVGQAARGNGSAQGLQLGRQEWPSIGCSSLLQQQRQWRSAHKSSALGQLNKQRSGSGEAQRTGSGSSDASNGETQLLEKLLGATWAIDTINFTIPFTNKQILLGKLPGRLTQQAGTVVQIALGAVIILAAMRHSVPPFKLAHMGARLLVGSAIGAVPLLGSFTRSAYNANKKNLHLLEKYAGLQVHEASKKGGKGSSMFKPRSLLWAMALPATAAAATFLGSCYFVLHKIGLL